MMTLENKRNVIMKKIHLLLFALPVVLCPDLGSLPAAWASAPTPAGDRGHHVNMIYPPDAFHQNGGPIIDITRAPYHAKGSGDPADATHNTRALIAVYDFLMKELDKYGDMNRQVTQPSSTECSYIVFTPYQGDRLHVLQDQRQHSLQDQTRMLRIPSTFVTYASPAERGSLSNRTASAQWSPN